VAVTDTLPAGLTFAGGAGAGWSFGISGAVVTATHAGDIAYGDSAAFTLTVGIDLCAYPAVTNSATVTTASDLDATNDRDSDPTAIIAHPDIALDKRHVGTFFVNQDTSYTFVVRNAGNLPTGAVTVSDTLPAGLAFLPPGLGAGWSFAQSGQLVTATFAGPIAPGDSSSFVLRVHVNQPAYPGVVNSATASTAGDSDPTNDRDSDPTTVSGIPILASTSITPCRSTSARTGSTCSPCETSAPRRRRLPWR
jgi:uncharacterized repeat protein (TIGR01451 family)